MKRKIVLIASLVAGLIAAVLTRFYIAAKDAEVRDLKDSINRRYGTMEVLCYAKEIPSGTALQKSDLGVKSVPAIGMRGQALTVESVTDIVGKKVLLGHRRGDVVFWADIEGGNPAASGLSADIKRQMRAISINCAGAASVSGMVKPNDHVDVIGTFDLTDPTKASGSKAKSIVTSTILQNVLVLAIGKQTAKTRAQESAAGYATVSLEVTPREAEMLAFTEQMKGRLVLTLRNRNDTHFEKELPKVDFEKIMAEIEELNLSRQQQKLTNR